MPRIALLWMVVGAVAAVLIATGHGPHVIGYLPFLVLFACPLMHMFMHGKHHHRKANNSSPGAPR